MGQVIIRGIDKIEPLLFGKKFLLVKDGAYDCLGIKEFFDGMPHADFGGFTSNPLYEQVCRGVEIYRNEGCEMVVAVGGGSAIDVAKCIKLYSKMDSMVNYLKQEMADTGIPLVAVPTTAGTGSESTCHAVIYYEGEKQSISHPSIVPDYAVLEPSVLKALPVYQKKCTMLDAFCQAVESWWSVNSDNVSKGYSRKAVAAIRDNWKAYIEDNSDEAAEKIMEAANYSGRAINITATTAAHAMSYKVTSLYRYPHGHAVAVCMAEVWKYVLGHTDECIDSRGVEYLRNTLSEIEEETGYAWFCNLLKELNMANPVASNREAEIEVLVQSVNPVRLKNHPVALCTEVLRNMFERIVR